MQAEIYERCIIKLCTSSLRCSCCLSFCSSFLPTRYEITVFAVKRKKLQLLASLVTYLAFCCSSKKVIHLSDASLLRLNSSRRASSCSCCRCKINLVMSMQNKFSGVLQWKCLTWEWISCCRFSNGCRLVALIASVVPSQILDLR